MRTTLKIDGAGAFSLAFSYLAPGASPGFAVVEVHQLPHGTPAAEVLARYAERIVNIYPYGPFRVSWTSGGIWPATYGFGRPARASGGPVATGRFPRR